MEINILEETKNRIKFEIKGESHTFCNALRSELWNDKNVEFAGYHIAHPLVSEPVMILETSGETPRKALDNAVERLKDKIKDMQKLTKAIKA